MNSDRIKSIEDEMDREGIRDVYDALLRIGNSPSMAAMLATQRPPASKNTDSQFCKRESERMSSMGDEGIEDIVKIAKKAGINTHGKTYNGALGKYGDPLAWVSNTSDVKNAAIEKGMHIEGMVNVNAYRGPKKKKKIAKDILDRLELNARAKDRKLDENCKKSKNARLDLRMSLTKKHTTKR